MNLLCHRCGANLSASELFCPNCGSPQLKFAQQEEGESGWGGRPPGTPPRAPGISWKDAILAALFVAVPAGLLSAVSVLSWGCCLWVVGGAVLAIAVYHRRAPAFLLETRSGVRIGAVTGLIAAYSCVIATAIWRVFARFAFHQGSAIDQFYESVI
jgi:ribosomal protein L40E